MNKYISLPFCLSVNGFCGSGKSYFIKYLIQTIEKFDCYVVFSNTANFTSDYEFLQSPKNPKISNFRTFIFSSVVADDKIKKILSIQKNFRETDNKKNVLLIFDDIFGSIKDSKIFKDLVSTYRHYNISLIFSTQYISGASAYLREISNYVVIFEQRTSNALKMCYENYFNEYETFSEFKEHFLNKLKDYQFYFIDRLANKKTIMRCPSSLKKQKKKPSIL